MFSAPGHVTALSFFYEHASEGLFLLFSLKDLSQIWPGKAEEAPLNEISGASINGKTFNGNI